MNGVSFILSSCSEMLISYAHKKSTEKINFSLELADGFKFIFTQKTIYTLCFFLLLIYALIQPIFTVVLPLFFRTVLDYPDAQYGFLQMIIVAGALLGSVLVGVLFGKGNKEIKTLTIGLLLLIGSMFAFSALLFPDSLSLLGTDTLLYFCIFSGVLGILGVALMFINIPVQTIIQKKASKRYMSRIFSVVGMISKGGLPFGALIYGLVLDRVEIHWTIFAVTILIILVSGIFRLAVRIDEPY